MSTSYSAILFYGIKFKLSETTFSEKVDELHNYCPRCKKERDSKYCPDCGKEVEEIYSVEKTMLNPSIFKIEKEIENEDWITEYLNEELLRETDLEIHIDPDKDIVQIGAWIGSADSNEVVEVDKDITKVYVLEKNQQVREEITKIFKIKNFATRLLIQVY